LESGERTILAALSALVGLAGMAVTVSLNAVVTEIRRTGCINVLTVVRTNQGFEIPAKTSIRSICIEAGALKLTDTWKLNLFAPEIVVTAGSNHFTTCPADFASAGQRQPILADAWTLRRRQDDPACRITYHNAMLKLVSISKHGVDLAERYSLLFAQVRLNGSQSEASADHSSCKQRIRLVREVVPRKERACRLSGSNDY
jgi:hypothetical protein